MGNLCSSSDKNVSSSRLPNTGSVPSSKEISSTTTTGKFSSTFPHGKILESPNLHIFTFAELKSATENFKLDNVLGEGGFGKVFKGWVNEKTLRPAKSGLGMVIAVKKFHIQCYEQWKSEVDLMKWLSHPNIVKPLGYCLEDEEHLVVYEFMPKGCLANHLFTRGEEAFDTLSWNIRLKIAIGAARGLAFLHSSKKKVIHRYFKPSNILLDSNYNAKLSDFALAMNGPIDDSYVDTVVGGTLGYIDPEYMATGHLYVQSDVYGFGVVLLEMLSGQRAIDQNRPNGQHNIVDWAKPYLVHQRKLSRIMDPRLEGQYPSKGAIQVAVLSYNCLAEEPKSRPSMMEVVETLGKIEAMKTPH